MKKIVFLLTLLSFTAVFAQKNNSGNYSYSKSNPYKKFKADDKYYFSQEGQSLAIKIDDKEIAIQKFDSGANLIKKKSIKNPFRAITNLKKFWK